MCSRSCNAAATETHRHAVVFNTECDLSVDFRGVLWSMAVTKQRHRKALRPPYKKKKGLPAFELDTLSLWAKWFADWAIQNRGSSMQKRSRSRASLVMLRHLTACQKWERIFIGRCCSDALLFFFERPITHCAYQSLSTLLSFFFFSFFIYLRWKVKHVCARRSANHYGMTFISASNQ